MADIYKFVENKIFKIIHIINNEFYDNCRNAAIHYNGFVHWFQRKFKELNFKSIQSSMNKALNDDQKKTILRYIDDFDHINMFFKCSMIVEAVNYFLRHENRQMHKHWFHRFKKRHFKLFIHKQKPLNADQLNSQNVKKIKNYFYKLRVIIEKKSFIKKKIYNMNKTEFHIDCDKNYKIINFHMIKSLRMMNSNNHDYIICVKCICVNNDAVFFLLIMKKVHIIHKWIEKNDLNENIKFKTNDTNYVMDIL